MPHSRHIAFIAPRFAEGATVGGAETLLRNLAAHAAAAGCTVSFLTTCARNHFTWANETPAGTREVDGMSVSFFPVDAGRDLETFLHVQERICNRSPLTPGEEDAWHLNNVNSTALCDHLRAHAGEYDRIVAGPYLFSLICRAAAVAPEKTLLVPCLHDEAFAYLPSFHDMFHSVRGCMFNTVPEKELAVRLYGLTGEALHVVGMGLDPFTADAARFRRRQGLHAPYVIYCGRREPLKGTPLLLDYLAAFRDRTGRDVKVVLTGSGDVHAPEALAPHILDLGFVPEQVKQDAMAGATAFCHPSVNESLSIVVLESWLAETPCLVHAGGAVLRDQCRRSNGGLWFKSYPEFEEELALLLDRPALRAALAAAGKRYVLAEYSWERVMERLFAALDA